MAFRHERVPPGQMPAVPGRGAGLVLYGALVMALVMAIYWPVFGFPYVQDDLRIVDIFRSRTASEILPRVFNPAHRLFYRPFSSCYYLLIIKVFDRNPAGFHAGAMIFLTLAAIMLALTIRELTRDNVTAAAAGLLYAAATPIHLDTMTWMVGMNELGAMLALLCSFFLFLRGRAFASAGFYLISLLFKEAGVLMPVLYLACLARGTRLRELPGKAWSSLWPHGLALALRALPKLAATPILDLAGTHPYTVQGPGLQVLGNLLWYAKWFFQSLFPWLAESQRTGEALAQALRHARPSATLLAAVLVIAAAWTAHRLNRRKAPERPLPWLLLLWLLVGLLPVVFFPNQRYRYYLTYALPPVLTLLVLFLREAAYFLWGRAALARAVVAAWLVFSLPFSLRFFHRRAAEGFDQRFTDGSNALFRRGASVNLMRSYLPRLRPDIPRESILLFQDIEVAAFDGRYGLSVWLDNPTLLAFDVGDVRQDAQGRYVEIGPTAPGAPPRRLDLDPRRTFVFRRYDGILADVTDEYLARPRASGIEP